MTARATAWSEASANLVRIVLPPVGVVSAVGLGAAGVVLDNAALGAGGALAGCLGAGAAWWQAATVEGRFRTERLRNRDAHRRLQLMIEDLRRRSRPGGAPAGQVLAALPAGVLSKGLVESAPDDDAAVAQASPAPDVLEPAVGPTVTDDASLTIVVPDTVPDVMPSERPTGAPAVSMELPVLSSADDAVAGGHLVAVAGVRAVPLAAVGTVHAHEDELAVYAAIAAGEPAPEPTAAHRQSAATGD